MRTDSGRASDGPARSSPALLRDDDPLAHLLPAGTPRYLRGPWHDLDLAEIGTTDRVLVLGDARAAVEAVLALDERGHRGVVCLVAPHGPLRPARERLGPKVAERLSALLAAGRLEVCAGVVRDVAAYGGTFVVDVLPRGRTLHSSERYDWILSCTDGSLGTARDLGVKRWLALATRAVFPRP